jgi:hypothetical protein
MTNAAKRDSNCELHDLVNHHNFECTLRTSLLVHIPLSVYTQHTYSNNQKLWYCWKAWFQDLLWNMWVFKWKFGENYVSSARFCLRAGWNNLFKYFTRLLRGVEEKDKRVPITAISESNETSNGGSIQTESNSLAQYLKQTSSAARGSANVRR